MTASATTRQIFGLPARCKIASMQAPMAIDILLSAAGAKRPLPVAR
jgi:hypothetical protein